jgi:hypothetical protein
MWQVYHAQSRFGLRRIPRTDCSGLRVAVLELAGVRVCLSCGPDGAHRCLEGIIRSSHKQRLSQRLVATTPVPMGMALRAGTRTH